ncbi:adhesion G-protein coupled receptor G4 isoform X2 [Puntigrus tetrazona]|uniref:adhesion G-protein coupled receptor G4 isoform X2 n=1 Tax=Puntigrus tetrazona TaxID=1606681 RepID=UPI001C8A9D82|nr:adhesion G-protein coupled receptor G4 isoform X2 [Puntigrus tetrazona]
MEKRNKLVQALLIFLILCTIPSKDEVNAESLWGKKIDFMQRDCSFWLLKNEHKIPSLNELSVCLNIKRKLSNSHWTAFTYLHPNKTRIELGLRGVGQDLHIIMFGKVWTKSSVVSLDNWHSICMTWSSSMTEPEVYVNGTKVELDPESKGTALHPYCCSVAGGGTLTLAVAHYFAKNDIIPETGTELKGSLSLFRMWERVRSTQDISKTACTDGDILHWEKRIWKKPHDCKPIQDVTQKCDWHFYEVKLVLIIIRKDGNKTNISDAQDIAKQWLIQALEDWPTPVYLHEVKVFPVGSALTRSSGSAKGGTMQPFATSPGLNQFDCLAHLTVINNSDVGQVQDELPEILAEQYKTDHYIIKTDADFIFIYPLDDFLPDLVTHPPLTATETHTTTVPQLTSTATEMITTAKTTGTTTNQVLVTTSSAETKITTATPFMETTLAGSSTAMKQTTALSSTKSLTLNTATCSSTIAPGGNISDIYFSVNVNVTINGSGDPENIIKTWLNETLFSKGIHVLHFKLLSSSRHARKRSVETKSFKAERKRSLFSVTSHSCVFHAQVTTSSNIIETEKWIHGLLEKQYTSGAVRLYAQHDDILISYIEPCPEHNHHTRQGLFKWPQTDVQGSTQVSCVGNPLKTAHRQCLLDANVGALWKSPDLGECQVVVNSVSDLEDITVTNDNAEDILIMIEDLIHEKRNLDEYELSTVLNKLADVINVSVITPPLGEVIINITSDILESDSNLLPFTNSILNITESVGDQMLGFNEESVFLTAPALAISVVNIDQGSFHNLTFGVSSTYKGLNPEIYINQEPFDDTVAFISLPSEIQERFPIVNDTSPRVQFQFYGVSTLFQTKNDPDEKKLNTYVVSASVTNATGRIENLKEYVSITLHHIITKNKDQDVQCVYWDFNKNDGYGGWNPEGCWMYNSSSDYTTCLCDHMTHFGVLLDVSRTPIDEKNEQILTLITYMGCGVSSCFLGITVLTYTLLEKLRRDYPSKILLNLSLALLGLNLVFLLNSWISSFGIYGLCVAVAVTLHYFLLTSFTWMGLGAVNMYFALVKVFNVYVPSYILKFCLLGWGIPLVICGLVLAIKRDAYGMNTMSDSQMTLDDSEMFCWVQNDVVFYVSVVSYIAFILLCNGSIFLVVLIQIRNMQVNQPAGTRSGIVKDLRAVASLTFLLGLTWSVAFLAWGPVKVFLLYLFSILNSLQGFFIFVFHCLMKENVRKQWRIHLCCGAFKLLEYSEWSQTATVVPKHKPNPPNTFPFMASVRSIKSNSTQSSTVSLESTQNQMTITRPDLGFVYENSLVIPRARTGLMALPGDTSPATASGLEFPSRPWKNGFNADIYPT